MPTEILTIGHSTRSLEEFLALLHEHRVALLADVRRFPASRRHPHFAREALSRALGAAGVDYVWLEALGGRRRYWNRYRAIIGSAEARPVGNPPSSTGVEGFKALSC